MDLRGTGITSLPEGLTVGGSLDLRGTGITSLPEGLTVGGSLDLRGTGITSLPEGLTVGGSLYLRGTGITNEQAERVKKLKDGTYVPGRYIYADGLLTHVKKEMNVAGYTVYVGRIKGNHVITDGDFFAHCRNIRDGIADLQFKAAESRGAEQYRDYDVDTPMQRDACIEMYRIITGACREGTEMFVAGIREPKEAYSIREIATMTRSAYGGETFRQFFAEKL